ncbi:MAG: hypothetical protein J0L61_09515 [Planctomycetes bacterium]|nr:hypothetical protein [Planctomycetota bacterium]
MNKGNAVKIVVSVVVLLIAVFIILKYNTSIFDSKQTIGTAGGSGAAPAGGAAQKPKGDGAVEMPSNSFRKPNAQ